ncbi:MAG TPA: hypothetical protein VMT88_06650 [Actinomycetes bacterium]|nr:hypothetical protein [Actinomycetes bacterium]
MTRRPLFQTLSAVALIVVVSGCGSDSPNEPAQPLPSGAASVTEAPCGTPDHDDAAAKYVGLTLPQAKQLAKKNDQTVRIIGKDGECFPITMDLRTNRVNLYLEDGIVQNASIG